MTPWRAASPERGAHLGLEAVRRRDRKAGRDQAAFAGRDRHRRILRHRGREIEPGGVRALVSRQRQAVAVRQAAEADFRRGHDAASAAAMGRDAAQTEDGRYRLLVEAVTDYAIWVLILIVSHNLGLRASSRRGIGVRQIGPQRNFGSFVYCQLRLCNRRYWPQ